MIDLRIVLVVVVTCISTDYANAHHNRTLFAFVRAVEARDFSLIRPIFSDAAWLGKDKGISVETLDQWLSQARKAEFEHARGHEINLKRLVMGFKFTDDRPDSKLPQCVYVLLSPVKKPIVMKIAGERFPCKWKVIRLTKDAAEAKKFLGHSLDYLDKCFYPAVPVPNEKKDKPPRKNKAGVATSQANRK